MRASDCIPNECRARTKRRQAGFSILELVVVVAIAVIAAAIAVPQIATMVRSAHLTADAHNLAEEVTLAKMRAAADFTQARVHVNLVARTYQLEVCTKNVAILSNNCTGGGYSWLNAGGGPLEGPYPLSQGVTFGTGGVAAAPANTQAAIGEAPACLDNTGAVIANSACITFNSRGISIDGTTASPTSNGAFYITNGNMVYGVTVTATGSVQSWRSQVNGNGFSAS